MSLDNPEAWVRKVLINLCTSRGRRMVARKNASARLRSEARLNPSSDSVVDRITIGEAISCLSPRQRAAVVLRHYEGLSLREIGKNLGCRPSTANTYLRRAYKALAETLGPDYAPRG